MKKLGSLRKYLYTDDDLLQAYEAVNAIQKPEQLGLSDHERRVLLRTVLVKQIDSPSSSPSTGIPLNRVENEMTELRTRIDQLESRNVVLSEQLKVRTQENARLRTIHVQAIKNIQPEHAVYHRLKTKERQVQDLESSLESQSLSSAANMSHLQTKMTLLNQLTARLHFTITSKDTQLAEAASRSIEMSTNHAEAEKARDTKEAALSTKVAELEAQLSSSQNELRSTRKTLAATAAKLKTKENEAVEVVSLRRANQDLMALVTDLQGNTSYLSVPLPSIKHHTSTLSLSTNDDIIQIDSLPSLPTAPIPNSPRPPVLRKVVSALPPPAELFHLPPKLSSSMKEDQSEEPLLDLNRLRASIEQRFEKKQLSKSMAEDLFGDL